MFRGIIKNSQATPSDFREALMLAAYCEEMENPTPAFHRIDSLRRIIEEERRVTCLYHQCAIGSVGNHDVGPDCLELLEDPAVRTEAETIQARLRAIADVPYKPREGMTFTAWWQENTRHWVEEDELKAR